MAFERVVISTDTVGDLVNALNANADLSVFSGALTPSGDFEFSDDASGLLFSIGSPGFSDQVTSGYNGAVSGTTPNYQVDYDAITYWYLQAFYSVIAGSASITAPDPNFDRIDVIWVDENEVVTITDGTASGLPAVPAVTGLVLNYIYVQRLGFGDPFLFTDNDEFIRLRISRSVRTIPNILTGNTTLVESAYGYLSDSNLTHTLPAAPSDGARLLIVNGDGLAATNPITINAGVGDTILGAASFSLSTNYGTDEFWYDASNNNWYVFTYNDPNVTPNVAPFYTTADETLTSAYSRVIAGAGTSNLTLPNAVDCFNGQTYLIKNRSGGAVNVIADVDFDGNPSPLVMVDGASYELIYSTDTGDWNIN